jgi:hypothetical protein
MIQFVTSTRSILMATAVVTSAPGLASSLGVQVLTVATTARFRNPDSGQRSGFVRVGRDPALRSAADPTCPVASRVELESYPQAAARVARQVEVALDCAKWKAKRGGWIYRDSAGPVRAIRYGASGLRVEFAGSAIDPGGPVGYLQAQLTVGARRYRIRVHNFRRNDRTAIRGRRPSAAAAAGEAAFWAVLLADDDSAARDQEAIVQLGKAARRSSGDGWSRFLRAMMHLYRFGRMTTDYADVDPAARAELDAANDWFAKALPLLWDGARGDSRVPGFAAAARYLQGVVHGDTTLRARGLADLADAVASNGFFNVFDYIPVIQATPPDDPEFAVAFGAVAAYLDDPATLACVGTQVEICANEGFAPHNVEGAVTLFGDVFAKGGDLTRAQLFYGLAAATAPASGWPFAAIAQDRVAGAAARVAAYRDADPTNDPPILGAGHEACAVCHRR